MHNGYALLFITAQPVMYCYTQVMHCCHYCYMLCTEGLENHTPEAEADFVGKYTTPVGLSVRIAFKILIRCLTVYILLKVLWVLYYNIL